MQSKTAAKLLPNEVAPRAKSTLMQVLDAAVVVLIPPTLVFLSVLIATAYFGHQPISFKSITSIMGTAGNAELCLTAASCVDPAAP